MCCILCEEPVRSITIGLAAVGIVSVVTVVRKLLASSAESREAQSLREGSDATRVGEASS